MSSAGAFDPIPSVASASAGCKVSAATATKQVRIRAMRFIRELVDRWDGTIGGWGLGRRGWHATGEAILRSTKVVYSVTDCNLPAKPPIDRSLLNVHRSGKAVRAGLAVSRL